MKQKEIASVSCWRDADQALARITGAERRLARMRERADERIAAIEERLGEESAELLSEITELRQELEHFFRENSNGLRSRTLPSGRIGLRSTCQLEIKRPQTTLHRLAERGLGDCIRVRQEIDRQALRRLDEEALKSVGVKRVLREVFYTVPRKSGK
jgi:phage host-nuclease inhibitor protein Gam